MTEALELAKAVKAWRGTLSVREAATLLGLPWRTLEHIEQGRGFRYPDLLRIAMNAATGTREIEMENFAIKNMSTEDLAAMIKKGKSK